MDSIGAGRQGNIGARVDEEGGRSSIPDCRLPSRSNYSHRLSCQRFQFAYGQIFFAQLNVVDARPRSLANFFQQTPSARRFIRGEGRPIGDVIEQHN